MTQIRWAYGITTVPDRLHTTLPQTLHSLCDSGFSHPQLFVDGCNDSSPYEVFGCLTTCRPKPALNIVGSWMLGMMELYVRNKDVDRYAMFQDDILCVGNLKDYLTLCPYPDRGYLNLYTEKQNHKHLDGKTGWHPAIQKGIGALGLVFSKLALQTLFQQGSLIRKPASAHKTRYCTALDGGVIEAMKNVGWTEYIHGPSLVQHMEGASTLSHHYSGTENFPGTQQDALDWI